ncbi:MAG: STAS domain-containing protein, partial [Rhodospirillaceae bacterium]|nr:STAS domain-containing protein [Rhodospirillaceae bacterium]MBT7756216.1 STAS domain-containing protein [Rhodospirillaceae bacterium]
MTTSDTMTVSKGSKMQISINTSGEITILELVGKLDTQTSPEAQARLDELIEQGGRKILVHLGQLDYISSAGL